MAVGGKMVEGTRFFFLAMARQCRRIWSGYSAIVGAASIFTAICGANLAHAEEIYTFVQSNCRVSEGLILDVSEQEVTVLDLDGNSEKIARSKINNLIIHNVVENPIPHVSMDEVLRRHLQKVTIGGKREVVFVGWPVRFVEDLVIFHDTDGKSHVVELDKVDKIRPPENIANSYRREGARPSLSLGDVVSECSLKSASGGVIPTRILSDQIQVSELLGDFQRGFEQVDSFRERTFLYAKPYMFEKETKLGIRLGNPQYVPGNAGVYYQWSTGSEYRFQSFNQFGVPLTTLGPSFDPQMVFHSELKSHFFSASFLGNLEGLSAGEGIFGNDISGLRRLRTKRKKEGHMAASLNYLALMGGDLGPWSFSFGTYFPVYGLLAGTSFREIRASDPSPMFRVRFTTKDLQIRVAFSPTKYRVSNPTGDDLRVDDNNEPEATVDSFNFKSMFLRGGLTYKFKDDFEVGLEQIIITGEYNEAVLPTGSSSFEFQQASTQLSLRHWFGRYVTLRVFGQLTQVHNDFRFGAVNEKENSTETNTGGVFEFVF